MPCQLPQCRDNLIVIVAPSKGRLEVIHGSMLGGKTEHLIAQLRHAQSEGKHVLAFKHSIDRRYDAEHLVTHPGDRFEALPVPNAAAILDHCDDADVVAVDEGHFFKLALIPVVRTLIERGVSVLVAGITFDSWGRPFEPIPQLVNMADEVMLKQAPCRICGDPSPFSQRMTPINTEFMVGGADDYEPRCVRHFSPSEEPPEQR